MQKRKIKSKRSRSRSRNIREIGRKRNMNRRTKRRGSNESRSRSRSRNRSKSRSKSRSRSRSRSRSMSRRSRSRNRNKNKNRSRDWGRSRKQDKNRKLHRRKENRNYNQKKSDANSEEEKGNICVQLLADNDDKPLTVFCTESTTIAYLRKKYLLPRCYGKEGFLGVTDIMMWNGEGSKKIRLFGAMTITEAELTDGAQISWGVKKRSAQSFKDKIQEGVRAKRFRLEQEFGDGRIVDACDDNGMWRGPATSEL